MDLKKLITYAFGSDPLGCYEPRRGMQEYR